MNSVKASELKAKCLNRLDRVAQTGEPLVITKNGKPVSKSPRPCAPESSGNAKSFFVLLSWMRYLAANLRRS